MFIGDVRIRRVEYGEESVGALRKCLPKRNFALAPGQVGADARDGADFLGRGMKMRGNGLSMGAGTCFISRQKETVPAAISVQRATQM